MCSVLKQKQYPAVALTERLGGHMWLYWQYLQNQKLYRSTKSPLLHLKVIFVYS